MNILKILEEKQNPLFNRKEIKVIVESVINPAVADSEKLLSEKFSKSVECIKIKKIQGKFGRRSFLISANIYSSEESKHKMESKKKKKSKKTGEAK